MSLTVVYLQQAWIQEHETLFEVCLPLGLGHSRTVLDTVGQFWTQEDSLGHSRTVLDTVGQSEMSLTKLYLQQVWIQKHETL